MSLAGLTRIELHAQGVTAAFVHRESGREAGEAEWRTTSLRGLGRYFLKLVSGEASAGEVYGTAEGKACQGVLFRSEGPAQSSERRGLLPHHGEHGAAPSPAFAPPFEVEAEILDRDRERCEKAAAALWLGMALSGVGQRSRRGAGSLQVDRPVDLHGVELPSLSGHADIGAYGQALRTGIEKVERVLRARLREKILRVQIVPAAGTGEQAVRAEVMTGLRQFKSAAFGLPYVRVAIGDQKIERNGGRPARWASPVLIHVGRLRDDSFVVVRSLLRTIGDLVGKFRLTEPQRKCVDRWFEPAGGAVEVLK